MVGGMGLSYARGIIILLHCSLVGFFSLARIVSSGFTLRFVSLKLTGPPD